MPFAFEEGDIRFVPTEPTKAPVMPPTIGAATPELNTVAAVAPPPAAIAVTPAFFIVVHPIKRPQAARTTNQLNTQPKLELLLLLPLLQTSSFSSTIPC